jgi:hypothetical protein
MSNNISSIDWIRSQIQQCYMSGHPVTTILDIVLQIEFHDNADYNERMENLTQQLLPKLYHYFNKPVVMNNRRVQMNFYQQHDTATRSLSRNGHSNVVKSFYVKHKVAHVNDNWRTMFPSDVIADVKDFKLNYILSSPLEFNFEYQIKP